MDESTIMIDSCGEIVQCKREHRGDIFEEPDCIVKRQEVLSVTLTSHRSSDGRISLIHFAGS